MRICASASDSRHASLFQLDLRACVFELLFQLFGFVLGHVRLYFFGRGLDEVFGFLEAEARDGPDFLDPVLQLRLGPPPSPPALPRTRPISLRGA